MSRLSNNTLDVCFNANKGRAVIVWIAPRVNFGNKVSRLRQSKTMFQYYRVGNRETILESQLMKLLLIVRHRNH